MPEVYSPRASGSGGPVPRAADNVMSTTDAINIIKDTLGTVFKGFDRLYEVLDTATRVEAQQAQAQAELDQLNSQVTEAASRRNAVQATLAASEASAKQRQAALDAEAVSKRQALTDELQMGREAYKRELVRTAADATASLNAELASTRKELTSVQGALTDARDKLTLLSTQVDAKNAEATDAATRLANTVAALNALKAKL